MKLAIKVVGGAPPRQKESTMPRIMVKAMPGRIAYSAPRGGKVIPHDEFIPVQDTPYVRRLANIWGDIEIQSAAVNGAPAALSQPSYAAPPPSTTESAVESG